MESSGLGATCIGLDLCRLNAFDVGLDLLGDDRLMVMIEREVEGDAGIGSVHAVYVRVHDLARDEKRHLEIRVERHLDPEHSMSVENLRRFMFDSKPDASPTEVHQGRREIRTNRGNHGLGGEPGKIRSLALVEG